MVKAATGDGILVDYRGHGTSHYAPSGRATHDSRPVGFGVITLEHVG